MTFVILISGLLISGQVMAQIPNDRILEKDELVRFIKPGLLAEDMDHDALIKYLGDNLKKRYYFDWSHFKEQFREYRTNYPKQEKKHRTLSDYHSSRYAADALWILPYTNLLGDEVTPYELRHLARQQKSMDMALTHYYKENKDNHIDYFTEQVASLNKAFLAGEYDDKGNGVYEVFRAGKRIHNWLFCHTAYMSDPQYTSDKQSLLIRTFLHHGAQLYKRLPLYRPGNHHTKGLVALFEIATAFNDFTDSEKWQQHALKGITEHIRREINPDGFQFERSVHYHKGDIENYFRVFQFAKRTQLSLPEEFTSAFKKMFDALLNLAQPNKKLPVLQDDTDTPFAENNEMGDVFFLASVMFEKPEYGYFSDFKAPVNFYWLMNSVETAAFAGAKKRPEILSTELPQTGYYVMRDGWADSSLQMVFSAGLSAIKPDHQHGDMLGITMFGLGTELLPNYQVAYKYSDFSFWKNSWVKNVALVDSHLQGQIWQANEGGSGFGKWKELPNPNVSHWIKKKHFDYIAASHDGFNKLNVKYSREIIFIKGHYWLISDNFYAEGRHTYQQVWQGKYKTNSDWQISRHVSTKGTFSITQLNKQHYKQNIYHFGEKQNHVFSVQSEGNFSFNTLLLPYAEGQFDAEQLQVPQSIFLEKEITSDAGITLQAGKNILLINAQEINIGKQQIKLATLCKVFLEKHVDKIVLTLLHPETVSYELKGAGVVDFERYEWIPGESRTVFF